MNSPPTTIDNSDAPHHESGASASLPQRLYGLDISRGIASFFVVVWHWQQFYFVGGTLPIGFRWDHQPLSSILKLAYQRGLMAVDYFFLLSGFVFFWLYRTQIANANLSFREFTWRRIARLFPLHAACLLLVAGLQLVHLSRTGTTFVYENFDLRHFILNLTFTHSWGIESGMSFNGPSWSISVEVFLYLFFFLFAYRGFATATGCLTVAIASFFASRWLGHPFFRGMTSFFLGGATWMFVTRVMLVRPDLWRRIGVATFCAWSLVLCDFYFNHISRFVWRLGWIGDTILSAFPIFVVFPLTVCSLILLERKHQPLFRRFALIGNVTYSSYLLHFPLELLVVIGIGYGFLPADAYQKWWGLISFLAILIALSYLVFLRFERPSQDWLLKLSGINGKPPPPITGPLSSVTSEQRSI